MHCVDDRKVSMQYGFISLETVNQKIVKNGQKYLKIIVICSLHEYFQLDIKLLNTWNPSKAGEHPVLHV